MIISLITAALPSRFQMLSELCYTVAQQTLPPLEHLIGVDYARRGTSAMRNELSAAAHGDWLAYVDDDDLLEPEHLELLAEEARAGADIVYSYCTVQGRDGWNPSAPFDAERLRHGNYIPATTLIRSSLVRRLGGWRDSSVCANGWEDWDFWLRALVADAVFACVDQPTWTYRFGETNKTLVGEAMAA